MLPSPCQGDLKFFLLLSRCILLLNLHEHVAGGVLLLADAPVVDGALLVYHWSWRSGQHPKVLVPSHNFPWPTKCLHIVINYVQEPDTCYQQGLAARRLRRRLRAQVQHPVHT